MASYSAGFDAFAIKQGNTDGTIFACTIVMNYQVDVS